MDTNAPTITIIEDNLSVHKLSALYEVMFPNEARAIIIKIVKTLKHGS